MARQEKYQFLIAFALLLSIASVAQNRFVDSLNRLIDEMAQDTLKVKPLHEIVYYYVQRNDTANAGEYMRRVLDISTKYDFWKGTGLYYSDRGKSLLNNAMYNKAMQYFVMAEEIYKTHKDNSKLATIYNNMGLVHYRKAEYNKAIEFYLRAVKIKEKINDLKTLGSSYMNIGTIYFSMKDYNEANLYFRKSLALAKKLNVQEDISGSFGNIAGTFAMRGEWDSAIHYLNQSMIVNRATGNEESLFKNYSNLGVLFFEKGKLDSSLKYSNLGLEYSQKTNDLVGMANEYSQIAQVYQRQKKYKESEQFFLKSLKIGQDITAPEIVIEATEDLGKLYYDMKDFKKAYDYQVKFKHINDSIFNIENTRQLSDVKTQFEVDKKETELNAQFEKEQQEKEGEIKQQRILKNAFIAGGIMLLVLVFFVYRNLRLSRNSNKIISEQKKEVENQKDIIEEKQKEIVDSIKYAKRIQGALLASKKILDEHLPSYFILFKPKDIVSGDFYWANSSNLDSLALETQKKQELRGKELFYLAVCDSTGHGVPGAMMSMLNISCLNEAVNSQNLKQPNEILNYTRGRIVRSLASDGSEEGGKDGMDCTLVCFDFANNILQYAAANNSFYIVRDGTIIHHKADKMPVGLSPFGNKPFTLYETNLQKGDMVYLLTDGYADQFGGEKGKKFKYKQLEDLLLQVALLPLEEQEKNLEKKFEDWKGRLLQVDDICIAGIRI